MKKLINDKTCYELACERVEHIFDRFDIPAVSFSGGKDSTVVLNLAMEERARRVADGRLPADWKLPVIFWDEECIHPETVEYVTRVSELPELDFRWLCLPIKHVNAFSKTVTEWHCWAPEKRDVWARPLPPKAITEMPGFERCDHYEAMPVVWAPERKRGATVGLMLGIRADESLRRFRSVTSRVEDNYISGVHNAGWVSQCKPIYDWTSLDVWTAPAKFGWDYNRAYDVMAQCGIPVTVQRVAPPSGQQALQTLWMWKVCWPTIWESILARIPGAAAAGRYAVSPLYGRSVDKPDDETWEQALIRELQKWAPEPRKVLVERLEREIALHARVHPGRPIPDEEPIYDLRTGTSSSITYSYLMVIARTGDFKNRVRPPSPSLETLNKLRDEQWGADWRTRSPALARIARRTSWDGGKWVEPTP